MEAKINKRNTGIDLFRICSMLMVIVLHILYQGGVLHGFTPHTLNYNIAWFIEIAAYCAVNCYALISGYVGIHSKHNPTTLATNWAQAAFYSAIITVIMHFTFVPSEPKALVMSILPVTSSTYWYFTSYFGMWFFIPFMNAAIENLPKSKAGIYLIIASLILLPISVYQDRFSLSNGYSVIWLCYIYLIGAYISKHKLFLGVSGIKSLIVYLSCNAITFLCNFYFPALKEKGINLISYVSPFNVLSAISLLVFFINLKIPNKLSYIIKSVSSVSFGVYLIHTHPTLFNNLWHNRFGFLVGESPLLPILSVIGCAVSVFAVCAVVDYVRQLLFKILKVKQIFTVSIDSIKSILSKAFRKFPSHI